jgi:hypothetical protein
MSILTTPLETPAQANARAIATNIQSIKTTLFGVIRDSSRRLDQPTLDVFGPAAGSLFVELAALQAYAAERLTANGDTEGLAELAALAHSVPQVEIHEDGTVTIVPPAAPAE